MALNKWKGATEADLLCAGAGVTPESIGTLVMPYKAVQSKQEGVQYRHFLNPDRKVMTDGPPGPATHRAVKIGKNDSILVVEAWSDGLTCPDGLKPVFLLGTDGSRLPKVREIVLCLDGDAPGRKAMRKIASVCVRTRTNVSIVLLPDDTDPADHTEDDMSRYVDRRIKITSMNQFFVDAQLREVYGS